MLSRTVRSSSASRIVSVPLTGLQRWGASGGAVAAMIAACHHGPTHARVDEVVLEPAGAEADAVTGFNQVPTV